METTSASSENNITDERNNDFDMGFTLSPNSVGEHTAEDDVNLL